MQKRRFIINVFIMSGSMLVIRTMSMIMNIYISARAGSTAMGIYHMIFSIFTFGITFAVSGTGFAVTRLISEKNFDEKSVLKKSLFIALIMSFAGFVAFWSASGTIDRIFIRKEGAAKALRMLAFALPCMSASAVFRGFFIAKRKAVTVTLSSLWEEGVCIAVTFFSLNKLAGTPTAYMSLVYGCLASNLSAIIFDGICVLKYLTNAVKIRLKTGYRPILRICTPVALGSYLRTALVATENLMIPMQFAKYGTVNPIGEYGIIKGMAMAVIMFPTVFIQAFSSMLVPEMSEMHASKRKNGIRYVFSRAIGGIMMFSTFVALMLFCHHDIISRSLFKEPHVTKYLGLLSLLAIPMYLDTVADSILKGLDLQNACLRYNIIDSALRVAAIFVLMPKLGPLFYIAMIYLSEIFNLSLSLSKAARVTGLKIDWFRWAILPIICGFSAYWMKNPVLQTVVYVGVYFVISKLKRLE